jgi:hypothetical protein
MIQSAADPSMGFSEKFFSLRNDQFIRWSNVTKQSAVASKRSDTEEFTRVIAEAATKKAMGFHFLVFGVLTTIHCCFSTLRISLMRLDTVQSKEAIGNGRELRGSEVG